MVPHLDGRSSVFDALDAGQPRQRGAGGINRACARRKFAS
jgi:hypothetical protein